MNLYIYDVILESNWCGNKDCQHCRAESKTDTVFVYASSEDSADRKMEKYSRKLNLSMDSGTKSAFYLCAIVIDSYNIEFKNPIINVTHINKKDRIIK